MRLQQEELEDRDGQEAEGKGHRRRRTRTADSKRTSVSNLSEGRTRSNRLMLGLLSQTVPSNQTLPESATSILNSIAYDLSSHSPESLDWLNVLSAQLISSYRLLASNHLAGGARGLMEEALNRKVRPNSSAVDDGSSAGLIGLDEIEVEEVELGEGFPELSNARVRPSGDAGEGLVWPFLSISRQIALT